jgi:hypothetical protein
MMPATTGSTAPGTGSRGSRPSTTGTRTDIPAMIRTLLNDRTGIRFPRTPRVTAQAKTGSERNSGVFMATGRHHEAVRDNEKR